MTRISSFTPGRTSSTRPSTAPVLPVIPTAVRVDPGNDTSEFSQAVIVSGFTVFNTNDSGFGSLRQAIINVNASRRPGITIDFKIPGTAPFNIRTLSQLPFVNVANTVIDATTQPDKYSGGVVDEHVLTGVDGFGPGGRMRTGDAGDRLIG